jgi:hypothetical protein
MAGHTRYISQGNQPMACFFPIDHHRGHRVTELHRIGPAAPTIGVNEAGKAYHPEGPEQVAPGAVTNARTPTGTPKRQELSMV